MPILKHYQHLDEGNPEHSVYGFRVGRFNLGITTTFIVYRIGDTLIDAGPSNQWPEVKKGLDDVHIQQLLITHHHEDHSGNAARLAKHYELLPYAPELGRKKLKNGYPTPLFQSLLWGKPKPVITQALGDTQHLSDGSPVVAIPTPGHAKDLTCLFLPQQKYLFSGDMYISKSIKYMRADENLQQLIDSLHTLLALDFEILFCPHNGIIEQGREALSEKLNNLMTLSKKAQALQREGVNIDDIVVQLLGPEDLIARLSWGNLSKTHLITQALLVTL